jgi:hypothetical protein
VVQLILSGRGCTAHLKGKKMECRDVVQIGILFNTQQECILNKHLAY